MSVALKEEITNFLYKFKFFAQDFTTFTFFERDINMQSLAELGISSSQAQAAIMQLTYQDYCSGPETDQNFPDQNIWTFGYSIDGIEVYIKLSDDFSYGVAKCISFHKAKFPLTYPYKMGGE